MKKLVKWTLDSYYSLHEGLFVIDSKYLDFIENKEITVWFGEIEGKHSNIDYVFDIGEFKVIDCSEDFINEFEKTIDCVGLNPFHAQGNIKGFFEDDEDLTIIEQIDKINEKNI